MDLPLERETKSHQKKLKWNTATTNRLNIQIKDKKTLKKPNALWLPPGFFDNNTRLVVIFLISRKRRL